MTRAYSLAHLTILAVPPPAAVALAARAGYARIGLRIMPSAPGGPSYPLMSDAVLRRETEAALGDTGVGIFEVETVRLEPETDGEIYRPMLEVGARLGARAAVCSGLDPDPARLADRFARICDLAAEYGMTADIEFIPWTAVPDLPAARRLLAAAGRGNARITFDVLHFDRAQGRIADLAALEPGLIHCVQLCDAPAEQPANVEAMIHTARHDRLLPGEGAIALTPMLRALPPDAVMAVEVPSDRLEAALGPFELLRRARLAAAAALEAAGLPA